MLLVKLVVYITCSCYEPNCDLFSHRAVELVPGESIGECAHKRGFCRSPGSLHLSHLLRTG